MSTSLGHGRLAGKTALITGAGSGIGYAMARSFLAEGARVTVVTLSEQGIRKWTDVDNVLAIQADLTLSADIKRVIEQSDAHWGGADILCNVAGINDLCFPLDETTDERWDQVMDLDLKAPFRLCRQIISGMVSRGGGVILNVGSYAAVRGNHGPSYSAAKHGLTGLSLSIAVGFARHGIRCNVINPGGVNTPLHSKQPYHSHGLQQFQAIVENFPVRWICEPEEIAPVAVFLCSDEAKHINGAVVAVDGGMSAC